MSQDGEFISSEVSPLGFSDGFADVDSNGLLGREPVFLKCCYPARSEAQGSKIGTADLQNIAWFL